MASEGGPGGSGAGDDPAGAGAGAGAGPAYDAVVLAGGEARRLGGTDKPALPVGGRVLLDRVLTACAGAGTTVVVGPRRPTARPVRWTREDPPGGGPLPALAAGLAALEGGSAPGAVGRGEVVVVLAADLPFLTASTVGSLVAALGPAGPGGSGGPGGPGRSGPGGPVDAVVLVDAGGREQPLAAGYRVAPLRRELALIRGEHGALAGLPLRALLRELTVGRLADQGGEAFDCDTWEDVAAARARFGVTNEE
jgi:molybdopterin-guanine dinucleotide biosynthesis protein A